MNRLITLQENLSDAYDPATICSFDYEAIQAATKPLIHQSARFLYIKKGKGVIEISGVRYDIRPNMLVAITPWTISEITEVTAPIQLMRIVYDYQYINSVLKGVSGLEEDSSELLQFLSMEPVAYLDSIQTDYIDLLAEQLRAELGVESTHSAPTAQPLSQLYVTNKLIELMILYRRYVMAVRGEKDYEKGISQENTILSYIYAHATEKLTLSSVAGAFFISESTLSKRISDITGTTFTKLLTSIRIEKVSDFLVYTDLTLDEIAASLGLKREDVVFALDAIQAPMSLHEPVYSDGGDALYVMDQVSDKKNREENWIEELSLEAAMERLNERERYIINLRFFEGKTQMEVADQINISQAQVSRLEKNALKIMRQYLLGS